MNWVIGDIQGCYKNFSRLLKEIEFHPDRDILWLVGDLVNRGRYSLEVLEYLLEIKGSVRAVLGNHDISLIATYMGLKKSNETIEAIVSSKMAPQYIGWLRSLPFVRLNYNLGFIMAHAGVPPQFNLKEALTYNRILQRRFQEGNREWLKGVLKKSEVTLYDNRLSPIEKEKFALSAFTRMRYCDRDSGELDFKQKGSPLDLKSKSNLIAWFDYKKREPLGVKVIFGHWSTLGFLNRGDILALDTGCVWKRELTAFSIEEQRAVSIKCS